MFCLSVSPTHAARIPTHLVTLQLFNVVHVKLIAHVGEQKSPDEHLNHTVCNGEIGDKSSLINWCMEKTSKQTFAFKQNNVYTKIRTERPP